jgi:hypothetical protein
MTVPTYSYGIDSEALHSMVCRLVGRLPTHSRTRPALLDGGKVSGKRTAEPGFEIVRSLPHGHVAAVKAMIGKLGLQDRSGVDKRVI